VQALAELDAASTSRSLAIAVSAIVLTRAVVGPIRQGRQRSRREEQRSQGLAAPQRAFIRNDPTMTMP
jgi:hypothetical protein